MKKLSLLFVSLLLLTNLLNAQLSEQDYKNVIKVNPIGIVVSSVPFSYERVIGKKSSIQVNASFSFLKSSDTKLSVILLGLDYKLYFSRDQRQAPMGFYISP